MRTTSKAKQTRNPSVRQAEPIHAHPGGSTYSRDQQEADLQDLLERETSEQGKIIQATESRSLNDHLRLSTSDQKNVIDNCKGSVLVTSDKKEKGSLPLCKRVRENSPEEVNAMASAAERLRNAIDDAVRAFLDPQESLKEASQDFTSAAKNFAKLVLSEQISRSFTGTIENGKSTESADEKIAHAREIRDLLAEWNFAIERNNVAVQLRGFRSGEYGNYRLGAYGEDARHAQTARWEDVKATVLNPKITEVTDIIYKSHFRGSPR